MILHTLWGARKGESTPELMVAWDEYTVDSYREGFEADCNRAIQSWGSDLQEKRYIDIHINEGKLLDAFADVQMEGTIR